ncbi:MAG: GNAT family N-acetyltransferase, partial [Prevotellaceae bacterium]|nr:GNAT family N-acetyltransferase [Prevotellaceae bacterium]
HVLIACITQGNAASVALHSKLGFVQVSRFHQVGRKFDHWLDVVDMELRL